MGFFSNLHFYKILCISLSLDWRSLVYHVQGFIQGSCSCSDLWAMVLASAKADGFVWFANEDWLEICDMWLNVLPLPLVSQEIALCQANCSIFSEYYEAQCSHSARMHAESLTCVIYLVGSASTRVDLLRMSGGKKETCRTGWITMTCCMFLCVNVQIIMCEIIVMFGICSLLWVWFPVLSTWKSAW